MSITLRSATRLLCITVLLAATPKGLAREPVRFDSLLGTAENLKISTVYRVRFENLDGRFRANRSGSDQILAERLLIAAEYQRRGFYIGGELQDSRQQLADAGSPIGTDDSNAAELLRAYIGWRGSDALTPGDTLDLTAGRLTIDVGSRRLSARNGFRNTINGFTGVHARWTRPKGDVLQAFYTVPVARDPSSAVELLDNDIEFDEEISNTRFWGLHYTRPDVFAGLTGEIYLLGLNEEDSSDRATRDRELLTPGFRLYRRRAPGQFDFEIETALQFGEAGFSSAPDAEPLDQFARFHHLHLGYTFNHAWQIRLVAQYDYASGDSNPNDDDNERFETLFGARRFEFGPTGIFGALARSNINSPGLRLEAQPSERWQTLLGYRVARLASARDALLTAGLSDPSGDAGSTIGRQIEARVRYELIPGNVRLEVGGAYFNDGRFLATTPGTSPDGDSVYTYTQVTFRF